MVEHRIPPVEDAIRRYFAGCRARIPGFVDRHFSLRGALAIHRAALGPDVLRAPVNLTMAAPAALLHVLARLARRLGASGMADVLGNRQLLLRTAVVRRIEWLIRTELLADGIATDLPCQQHLARSLAEYGVARGAAAEITGAAMSLGAGAVTVGKLTPGAVSFAPVLAAMVAQQAAISSFPLGAALGSLWYGLFPVAPSPLVTVGLSAGLLALGSVIAAFAGVIADPVQRRLGLHQRRLHRMIDALERQALDPAAPDYTARDRYLARLLDSLDLITAAWRLTR
ncbi:MAG TPA: DUF6635 family protein [Acetobacteraceae bacterium]|jgi:hypothetical protein